MVNVTHCEKNDFGLHWQQCFGGLVWTCKFWHGIWKGQAENDDRTGIVENKWLFKQMNQ